MDADDRNKIEMLRLDFGAKLDRMSDRVDVLARELARFTDDHEKRMRSLERWKYAIPASVLMMAAAFIGGRVG